MGTASREAIIIMEEEEKRSHANLAYCLSCFSFWTSSWLCGVVSYIMAFKAEESKENGDSRRYKIFNSLGVIFGVLGIFFGLATLILFYNYIFPVWYRYLYLMVEPEYRF